MPDESISHLEQIAELLNRHGVRFIVIGGQAEWLMGGSRLTFDVDLCYDRREDNLHHLAEALQELGVTLRNAPPDLPFTPDARTLSFGSNFTFSTPMIDLDLLGYVEPIGGYDQLIVNAETWKVGESGLALKVIALDDLIRIKQHLGRPKDQASLVQLKAIKQVRQEQTE